MTRLLGSLPKQILPFTLGILIGSMAYLLITSGPAIAFPSENIQSPLNGEETAHTPSKHLQDKDINIYNDQVTIHVDDPKWAGFKPTGSMKPLIDHETIAIQIEPTCKNLQEGDIISYESSLTDDRIIHRITQKETDENGIYFRAKGDNNDEIDPEKIRCSQIKRKTIGILY